MVECRLNNKVNKDSHLIFEQYSDVVQNIGTSAGAKPSPTLEVITKLDRQNLDNSEVTIPGYGVLLLSQLKNNVAEKLQDLAKRVRGNEPKYVLSSIAERHSVLMVMIKTLARAEKDIERMRRAGKLPGFLKRYL